jgi:hypothetical protein
MPLFRHIESHFHILGKSRMAGAAGRARLPPLREPHKRVNARAPAKMRGRRPAVASAQHVAVESAATPTIL